MAGKSTTWVGGTVVAALLILVATWFVGVSPTIAATSAAHDAADAADTRNVKLRADLDRLKQQFAELDSSKAELAAIARQIPTEAQFAEYLRTVQATAEAAGVAFIGYEAGLAEAVVPVEPEVLPAETQQTDDAAATDAGTDAATDGAGGPAQETVPAGFVPIEGFVGIPFSVTVLGPAANTAAFVDQLQNGPERLFLVTALDGDGQKTEDSRNGRPPTTEGDLELRVTGFLYGLAPLTAPTEEPTLAPLPPEAPLRMSSTN